MKKIVVIISIIFLSSCSLIDNFKQEEIDNQEQEIEYHLDIFDDKFYYSHLSDIGKKYYYLFYEASLKYENMIEFNFEYIDVDFLNALSAFRHDWPIYYWWSRGVETITKDNIHYTNSKNFDRQKAIDNCNKINKICSDILSKSKSDNEIDTLKNIHNNLVELLNYDNTTTNAHNIVGALIENKCACDGYADSFQAIATLAGFNCVSVVGDSISSTGKTTHAWNIVEVNDNWYGVDVTWDDPVYGEDTIFTNTYEYFLTSDEIMNIDHFASPNYLYNKCNDNSLYYYDDAGMFSEDGDRQEIKDFIIKWLNQGKTEFAIKFKNNIDPQPIFEWLIDEKGFADIFANNYDSSKDFSYGGHYIDTSHTIYIYYSF